MRCFIASAAHDPIQTFPLLGSKDSVKVNYISTVVDYQNLLRIANPSLQPLIEAGTTSIQNRVSVGIEEDNKTYIQTDFTATLVLHIKKYSQSLAMTDEFDSSFTVNYAKAEGAKYTSLKYLLFNDAYKVEVKIVSIDPHGTTSWDVAKVLRVDNTLQATRDYAFTCSTLVPNLALVQDVAKGELTASWSDPNNGQTEYDLEWAWIDESAVADYQLTGGQFSSELLFSSNATRVTVNRTTYNIPLLYDGEGRIFVRVRPAQIRTTRQRVEGEWTWLNAGSTPVFFSYTGHERMLNWQASTSFAEEGKRKSVVQYFDGTLRNRQTVTKDNTTGTTVVAESFYDYQGRPVIQVLPAPTLNTAIGYSQNFNKAVNFVGYPKWAYDKLAANASICGNSATKMDPVSGTAKYYSPNNDLINTPATGYNPNKYIPDAEGYPFTETRFTPDGRVSAQSGVGPNHQLGSNHETKYVYEALAQEELDALFGTDAGIASHYFKNIVKDANGQYSISYTDMHGRTIATALAGESPQALEALPSKNKKYATKQLIDNETNRVVGKSIISSKSIAALNDATFTFKYQLNPEQLQQLSCSGPNSGQSICYDCLYNLKITITADCNIQGFPYTVVDSNFTIGGSLTNPVCNTANPGKTSGFFNKTFAVWMPEGSYTVTKVLSMSDSAQRIYRDSVYVKNDTCKKFTDFYNEIYQVLVAQSNCAITCPSCDSAIGHDLAGFRVNFVQQTGIPEPLSDSLVRAVTIAYNNARANCDRICNGVDDDGLEAVRGIRRVMLLDVSPGGQYADPGNTSGTYDIFNTGATWPEVFSRPRPAYMQPVNYSWNAGTPSGSDYLDAFGQPVLQDYSGGPLAFTDRFQTAWAEQLLPHHPEYVKLKTVMEKLPATYHFEADLNKLNTWSSMVAATVTPGQYITNMVDNDPFFHLTTGTAPGSAFYTAMSNKINQYVHLVYGPGTTPGCSNTVPVDEGYATLWQLAQSSVFCRNASAAGCENSDQSNCLRATVPVPSAYPATGCATDWDMVWKNFRTIYLSERKKMVAQYLDNQLNVITATVLSVQHYTPRFTDIINTTGTLGTDAGDLTTFFNQLGNGDLTANTTGTDLLNAQYDSTCRGYANTWIMQLSQCDLLSTRWQNQSVKDNDSTWLVERLRDICEHGSDQDHFLGSASINPTMPNTTTYGFSDFPSVIQAFFQNNGIIPPVTANCNPYLITTPKPYDKQPALVNTAVVTKPTECECNQINNLFFQYTQQGYPGTFSNFLENNYQTYISQGALDTLRQLCNGTYQCAFLPTPISLPPVLQCHSSGSATDTSTCINCQQYQSIKDSFAIIYSHAAPIVNPQTQQEIDWNMAFENYANYKTGFSKNWIDYVNFGKACDSVQTIPCASLDSLLQLFYQSTVYHQNPTGTSCKQSFVTFFNNAFGTFNSYDQWMNIFQQSCGQKPDPCSFRLTCTILKGYINDFYATYGVQVHTNANCMQLFVTYINSRLHMNFTYAQIEANYQYLCGVSCSLDICSFPNCYLLTMVYDKFKADNGGHPWMLPDCQGAFVTYFNSYFGMNPAWDYSQIQGAYVNCSSVIFDGHGSCAPILDELCTPDLSCPSLQYIVQLFHERYDTIALPNCRDTFVVFFNSYLHTNYTTWEDVAHLYAHYCGEVPNVCNGDDIDCHKLIAFAESFTFYDSDISCEEAFRAAFNTYFHTGYDSFMEIYQLYKTHCSYIVSICGKPHPAVNCTNIMQALADFMALYPDPPTQLGADCQNTFRSFFNTRFGIVTVTGGYSYAIIQGIYANCGYALNICGSGAIDHARFAAYFNARFGTLKLPLATRKQLFTVLYNETFINNKSINAERDPLKINDQQLMEESKTRINRDDRTVRIVSDFEAIRKALPADIYNALVNVPAVQSAYDPDVLLSMKQAYYVMHPTGLPSDCEADYASWFNISMGTTYSFKELFAIYNNVCGNNAGYICSVPDAVKERELRLDEAGTQSLSPYQSPLLCGLNEPVFHTLPYDDNPCKDLTQIAYNAAEVKWQLYTDSVKNAFDLAYYNKCISAKNLESFTVSDTISEYHYTLYYYDQAGNLVRTVPPAGIDDHHGDAAFLQNVKNARSSGGTVVVPAHLLATEYRYNTLNQVIGQKTPDAGASRFWYDYLGRLAVSQNAKQLLENKYSYTEYDALGRISQVGQKPQDTLMTWATSKSINGLDNWLNAAQNKEQITRTVYDFSYYAGELPTALAPTLYQRNVRNRVSYTQVIDAEPAGNDPGKWAGVHTAATYYSYDIHGNVDTLVQDFGSSTEHPNAMNTTGNRWKKLVYDYDLVSGKVNEVAYQPGAADAFYHKYSYDAENRLTDVETSSDKVIWEKDARYSYYKHGPLARTILGQNQVQGLDYAYSLHGWLKGVNSTSVSDGTYDMGGDGKIGGTNVNVARDAFGFALHYYQNDAQNIADYKSIGGAGYKPFPNPATLIVGANTWNLFNGNIAAMAVNIPKLGTAMQYKYKYDQLNRLVQMYTYTGLTATNTWNVAATDDYREQVSYDANGNIKTYNRNGTTQGGSLLAMDKFTYQYEKNAAGQIISNKLRYVHDQVANANYSDDIDSQTSLTLAQVQAEKSSALSTDNYQYDAIGNLIKDTKEGISAITWNVYGKISSIAKGSSSMQYAYDASGNRISKTFNGKTTFYIRDAGGNIMSTYESGGVNSGALTQTEINLYGSSRLGIYNLKKNVQVISANQSTFERGNKFFELSNHLGNVLITISDKKLTMQDPNSATQILYYTADVITATDYYPFGQQMAGRKYSQPNSNYRYGFNGKENDKDISEGGLDFGARIYDGRLGRWLSVDPLQKKYPSLTPYNFVANSPLIFVDPNGKEIIVYDSKGVAHQYKPGIAPPEGSPEILMKVHEACMYNMHTEKGTEIWNQLGDSKGILEIRAITIVPGTSAEIEFKSMLGKKNSKGQDMIGSINWDFNADMGVTETAGGLLKGYLTPSTILLHELGHGQGADDALAKSKTDPSAIANFTASATNTGFGDDAQFGTIEERINTETRENVYVRQINSWEQTNGGDDPSYQPIRNNHNGTPTGSHNQEKRKIDVNLVSDKTVFKLYKEDAQKKGWLKDKDGIRPEKSKSDKPQTGKPKKSN